MLTKDHFQDTAFALRATVLLDKLTPLCSSFGFLRFSFLKNFFQVFFFLSLSPKRCFFPGCKAFPKSLSHSSKEEAGAGGGINVSGLTLTPG